MTPGLRQRLLRGDTLLGCMVTLDAGPTVETLCALGFDWLFVETEHAPLLADAVQRIVQTAGSTPCLVRVASGDEVSIKRALDAGAAGIIVPQVNSAAEAHAIVRHAKFPPAGTRGIGLTRASGYGLRFAEYLAEANDTTCVVVQAEHIAAVEEIEAIAAVPGVDAVFVGPYDLSASLDRTGQLDDPLVRSAIDRVRDVCLAQGRRLGYYGGAPAQVVPRAAEGFTLLCCSTDISIFAAAARQLLDALRPTGG